MRPLFIKSSVCDAVSFGLFEYTDPSTTLFPVLAIGKLLHFRKDEEGYNQTGLLEHKYQVMVMWRVIAAMICVIAVWICSLQFEF